jgi:hypothetical protein
MAKLSPFEQAFADARAEGKKTFSFNGKLYGTTTAEDVQKKINAMPSMSRTTGAPVQSAGARYVTPPHTPTPSAANARSLVDQGKDVDIYKDVDKDAVLNAGLALASVIPAVRASRVAVPIVTNVAKRMFQKEEAPPELSTFENLSPEGQEASKTYKDWYQQQPKSDRPTGVYENEMKKGGYVKAKGGKINLDACGVSTHTPSKKKHANW